jgi:predicted amidohydrolase
VVRIALGQINTTVGDLAGNVATMARWAARATEAGADLEYSPHTPRDVSLRST